jgi:hypothetical protein
MDKTTEIIARTLLRQRTQSDTIPVHANRQGPQKSLAAMGKRGGAMTQESSGVDLYWLPLGAGGHFVRFNGRVYEAIEARRQHRERLDIFHTALEITVPESRFVIENSWPIPDAAGATRGVVVEGPVGSHLLGRFRVFRYEIRCWPEGTIPDVADAVASPQRISSDERCACLILDRRERSSTRVGPSPT